jgi:hypothetical protein
MGLMINLKKVLIPIGLLLWSAIPALSFSADTVKCVQNQLNASGFDVGIADGLAGQKTRRASVLFQEKFGKISERPLDRDHALIYCRMAGELNQDLKQFWPSVSGKLAVEFSPSMSSGSGSGKLFSLRLRAEIEDAHGQISELLQIELANPVKFLVVNTPDEAIAIARLHSSLKLNNLRQTYEDYCSSSLNLIGSAYPDFVILCRNGQSRIGSDIDMAWMKFVIIHEYFHQFQFQLAGALPFRSDQQALRHDGPQWLLEGSAQVVANRLATGLPLSEYQLRMEKKLEGNIPSLSSIDSKSDLKKRKSAVYRGGVIAVGELIPNEDYTKLGLFYEELGRVSDWTTAFETVFGMTVKEFYSRFDDKYR